MLRVADLQLDMERRRVTRDGRLIRLQPRELRLHEYLMRRAGRVVTRTMLRLSLHQYRKVLRTLGADEVPTG